MKWHQITLRMNVMKIAKQQLIVAILPALLGNLALCAMGAAFVFMLAWLGGW